MSNSLPEPSPSNYWLANFYPASQHEQTELEDETTTVLRAVDEALIEDDRPEMFAQFDRAIVMLARDKRWRSGLQIARRVYDVVKAWQDFDSSAYSRTLAQFTFNYALELQQAHVLGAAEDFLREAYWLFEECGDAVGGMRSEYELGRALQEHGELRKAKQCYLSSLQRAQLLGDRNYVCRNLLQLGQVAQLDGELDASMDYYHRTLALSEEIKDDLCAIAASHQLGLITYTGGDYVAAADRFNFALARAEKINDARGASAALHQLGMVSQAQDKLARAVEMYRASLTQAAKLPDPAEQAPTLYQLAQCAWMQGEHAAAQGYCQQSLSLLQAQGNLVGLARVKRLLSSIQSSLTS